MRRSRRSKLSPPNAWGDAYALADNRISREVFGGHDAGTSSCAIENGAGANQVPSMTRLVPDAWLIWCSARVACSITRA